MFYNINPLVAIKCLVYNHEPYLRDCLEGFVMQQTDFPFVAIVHDDASTDRSADIIREYAAKYPDIIHPIYETENQYSKKDDSLRRIMDAAIAATGAGYIALCEGDDYWTDPHKLQKQVEYMETHLTCSLCFHKVGIVSEKAGDVNLFASLEERDYSEREIYETWVVPTCSVVYRYVPDLQKHLSVPLVYGDIYLFLSLLKYGTAHCLNFEGAAYRRHEGSITWNMSVESLRMLLEQYKMMEQQFPNVKDITIQNEKNYLNRLFARQSEMDGDSIWKYRLWMCRLYPYLYFQRYFLITLYKYMLKVYCKRWFSYRKK